MAVEEKPVAGTASKTIPGTKYDYLLSMAIGTLTYEKMQQLWNERDTKKAEFDELTNTPSKSLWLRDLDGFNNQLDEQDKRDAKDKQREGNNKKRLGLRVMEVVGMLGNLPERLSRKKLLPHQQLLLNQWRH